MAERQPQNLQNHAKFDPPFHFFLAPVALIILIAAVMKAWHNGFDGDHIVYSIELILGGLFALVLTFKVRLYSLKVQDRVIRLEERLRLEKLLPEPLKSRIYELTEQQLIALRFASDGELPGLVQKTLAGNLKPKEIKQAIQSWRPDYWRV
jgi:Family of unknown function (DUF6526)